MLKTIELASTEEMKSGHMKLKSWQRSTKICSAAESFSCPLKRLPGSQGNWLSNSIICDILTIIAILWKWWYFKSPEDGVYMESNVSYFFRIWIQFHIKWNLHENKLTYTNMTYMQEFLQAIVCCKAGCNSASYYLRWFKIWMWFGLNKSIWPPVPLPSNFW